ncbi:transposase family protein [Streptomyces goshikiensis]
MIAELADRWLARCESELDGRCGAERQREASVDLKCDLVFTDRLLVTLVHLRDGLPHSALTELYGIARSTISGAIGGDTPVAGVIGAQGPQVCSGGGVRVCIWDHERMSEESNLMSSLWPLVPSGATDWLLELCGDGLTGFMPPAMPDAAWVLNAMYEHEHGPADISYHEYRQARLADGSASPHIVAGIDLDAVVVDTGGGLGRAQHPGPGWRRLRWAELARRTGGPAVPDGLMPSYRCFPSAKKEGSWPLGMVPPAEGSLDRETWNRLIAILTERSPAGPDTRCLAYYSPLVLGFTDYDNLHVRAGRLGDAEILYDQSEADFSPSNLWADDRSWVLCTDYDLWATKIAGPPALINALLNDTEIEAVRLPWAH